jgi:hypothetical protein
MSAMVRCSETLYSNFYARWLIASGVLMQKFEDSLKLADITLWLHLQNQEIKPQYYAFRWLTLLLSQEFELPGRLFRKSVSEA